MDRDRTCPLAVSARDSRPPRSARRRCRRRCRSSPSDDSSRGSSGGRPYDPQGYESALMPESSQIDPGRLPEAIDALPGIDAVRRIAERVPTYLVGGAVRDLLLGADGADLDVAIEGDASALSDIPGYEPERDELFLTGRLEVGDRKIDIAQSRAETYPRPGALPEVRPAPIAE